jgi:Putative metallopeptidase
MRVWRVVLPLLAVTSTALGAKFKVVYADAKDAQDAPIAQAMRERRILEAAGEILKAVRLPRTLTLKTESCGEPNAWYDSDTDVVTFCYELVREMVQRAGSADRMGLTREQAILGPFAFIVFHETAHAVFALLKIPILGREEDAADQVATFAALRIGDDFAERMLRAAAFMYDQDAQRKLAEDDFADVHGLDRQRYYNVLCLAWGADPKRYAFAKELGHLPDDRAEGCADEYAQVKYAVAVLIRKSVDQAEVARVRAKFSRSNVARPAGAPDAGVAR